MKKLTLGDLKSGLERLTLKVLEKEVETIILKDDEIIFQKQDEFEVGQNPDGTAIGEYKDEDYRLFKMQINPLAGGKVDLILTGSTKSKLRVKALGNGEFILWSEDWKWPMLVEKYGQQITKISKRKFEEL